MSTVPEVIVAVHGGMRVLGISIITDQCLPDALEPVSIPEIIATANEAEKHLRVLVPRVVAEMCAQSRRAGRVSDGQAIRR
jgi:purine-nucleoside phosphorylase